MAKPIPLSFKENEIELYNFIKSKSSPSAYMKELLKIAKCTEDNGGNIYSFDSNNKIKDDKDSNIHKNKHEQSKPANSVKLSSVMAGR